VEAGGIEPQTMGKKSRPRDVESRSYNFSLSRYCPSLPAFWAPGAHEEVVGETRSTSAAYYRAPGAALVNTHVAHPTLAVKRAEKVAGPSTLADNGTTQQASTTGSAHADADRVEPYGAFSCR